MMHLMASKNHSNGFRRQAVGLFESTPGATSKGIAADPGIAPGAGWAGVAGARRTRSSQTRRRTQGQARVIGISDRAREAGDDAPR